MKILVYVEGDSDVKALQVLLKPILTDAAQRKISIKFLALGGKSQILKDVPRRAAQHLGQNPADWVFALPDLYPIEHNGSCKHRNFAELEQVLQREFAGYADKHCVEPGVRAHFRPHCFKHDLEVLVLAAPLVLGERLKLTPKLHGQWRVPVEDQNDNKPPKAVVNDLFKKHLKRKYEETQDAVWILAKADLFAVEAACPQNFAPFLRDLRSIVESTHATGST